MLDRQTDRQTDLELCPSISVIIPVYNVEKYLCGCLDSVLEQTFTDLELILIDDGSQDTSGAICDKYAGRDARVRVIHQKNQGQSAARNNGVRSALGTWIAFVDSDDMIHPQYLEILYHAAIENNTKISMCDSVKGENIPNDFYDDPVIASIADLPINEETLYSLHEDHLLKYCDVWGKLIDKTIVQKIPFTEGRIYEDTDASIRWFVEAGHAADIDWPGYFYRDNPNGTMNQEFTKKRGDLLWVTKRQIEFYRELGYQKMVLRFARSYLLIARDIYLGFKDTLNDKDGAEAIKKEFDEIEQEFGDQVDLTTDEKDWIYSVFHPIRFRKTLLLRRLKGQ